MNKLDNEAYVYPESSGGNVKIVPKTVVPACDILKNGAKAIDNRASERDTESERSMEKAVKAFNVMYNKDLTTVEGWQFMVMLKQARGAQGNFRLDDYVDQASYSALAGEAAQEV